MTAIEFPRLGRTSCERLACVLAAFIVLIETRVVQGWSSAVWYHIEPHALAAWSVLASVVLTNGNAAAHGLVRIPHQGWGYWIRFGLMAAAVILVLCIIGGTICWWMGWAIPIPRVDAERWPDHFRWMCVVAPIHEELVYRVLLTVALFPVLGFYGTVIAGGVIFAAIHALGGNPGPDNQIAGFFLQWAYLRSGTVLVPLAMHASGNAIALSAQLLAGALSPTAT